MARVRPITAGAVTGSDTIVLKSGVFGGFRLNTDGTNAGTVVIRDNDASGTILVDVSSISTIAEYFPVDAVSGQIYYTISGTNADAQLYEWQPSRMTGN